MTSQTETTTEVADEFADKNLLDLVEMLEPIAEPVPISMTPQTIGWLVVAVIILLISVWLLKRWYAYYRANAYRRAAVQAVKAAAHDPVILAEIIRRTALCAFPRQQISKLHGTEWLEFLNHSYGGSEFTSDVGSVIAVAPYRETKTHPELSLLAEKWIKQHQQQSTETQGKQHD